MTNHTHNAAVVLAVLARAAGTQASEPFTDVLVQPPELAAPERGSVAGSYPKLALGPASVVRGAFTLAGPFEAPSERGGLLFSVFPGYSPETGLTEWGMGWQAELAIRRHRVTGDLDYQTDGFTSPWGRLAHGQDGYWYVLGLQSTVRLAYDASQDEWTAVLADGTRVAFAERVTNPAGTYAWYFTDAESVLGARTAATYVTNESGRPFLKTVTFGSQGHTDTYRIQFDYESTPHAMISYAPGHAQVLDRRVLAATVEAREGGDGAYQLRWRFDLGYRESALGPAYFLDNVTKTYASGLSDPPFVYQYNEAADHLQVAAFEHIPELDAYLAQNGASALRQDEVTYVDADSDGVTDIEHSDHYTLFRHTEGGWLPEPLPEPPWDVDGHCRSSEPIYNLPRSLARLTGAPAAEPNVIATIHDYFDYVTTIKVCNREGSKLFEQQYSGRWDLSRNIRLADLNRDHRPDIVAFWRSNDEYHVQVLENTSDDTGFGFAEHPVSDLPFDGVFEPRGTWVHASVQIGELVEYLAYERERCATAVQTTSQLGLLNVETELANVALLGEAWHCLPATETVTGSHLDASPDFVMEQEVFRNDYGQPYRVEQRGDGSSLTVQEIGYTPDHKVHTVGRPGRGVTTVAYNTSTGLLETVIGPDGVERTVESRDAITDALLGITQDRGPGGLLEMSYRFDGQERLWKSWDDFGGATESEPATEVRYGYATFEAPAFIWGAELVNVASGSMRNSVSYLTAAGEEYASALRMPNAWQVPELTERHPSDGTTQEYRRTPLDAALGPEAVGYSDLGGGLVYLGEAQAAGFGYTPYAHRMVATAVEQTVTTSWSLANDALVQSTIENESSELQTARAVDAGGRVLWSEDQAGNVTEFDYDALGRMVGVRLPDEAAHLMRYDAFGRPSTIVRDGVGSIAYEYQAFTGLLETAYFSGTDGVLERTVDYQYDDIGRLETATHTLASTGETEVYRYTYDGSHESPPAPGQLGHLTRVEGSEYVRTSSFNRDDSLRESRWVLADWRELVTSWTYNVDGSAHSITRQVLDASTQEVIEETEQVFVYDPYGRLEEHWINSQAGSTCLTYSYDDDGLLDSATATGGDALAYSYDDTTHAPDGYSQTGQSNTATVEWTFNTRGLVERELLSVGAEEWDRGYLYEPRGFLESATDAHGTAAYSYSPTGMPETTSDLLGTRSFLRVGNEMLVGDEPYVYDHLGRVVVKGDRRLRYGPTGEIAASRTVDGSIPSPQGRLLFVSLDGITVVAPLPTEWRYAYDEAGNRILKADGSRPVAGYVEGGYLQDSGFVEPIRVAGRVIGIVEGGAFHMLATDPRGTLMADSSGQPNVATPYGVRAQRPDLSAVLDYVEKGYDSDLGTVRFGLRDYDPFIGQWLTPDPLFLAEPGRCVESPVECNLYSYALGNPVVFSDPSGEASITFAADQPIRAEVVGRGVDGTEFFTRVQISANGKDAATMVLKGEWHLEQDAAGNQLLHDGLSVEDTRAILEMMGEAAATAAFAGAFPGIGTAGGRQAPRSAAVSVASRAPRAVKLLPRAQAHVNKINNIIRDHAKPSDFQAVAKELSGVRFPKIVNGRMAGYWNHIGEMRQSLTNLGSHVRALRAAFKNPRLTAGYRQALLDHIHRAEDVMEQMSRALLGEP